MEIVEHQVEAETNDGEMVVDLKSQPT